jgi:hypothetical protein
MIRRTAGLHHGHRSHGRSIDRHCMVEPPCRMTVVLLEGKRERMVIDFFSSTLFRLTNITGKSHTNVLK